MQVGRGPQLVEDDLLAALRGGRLRGAVLDVFDQEPLPPEHPFWAEPGIVVTPHMATMPDPDLIHAQILANIARLEAGLPLANQIDPGRGY